MRKVKIEPNALATRPVWTEARRAACAGRCGDMGEHACWQLPQMTSDMKTMPHPCKECIADAMQMQSNKEGETHADRMEEVAA